MILEPGLPEECDVGWVEEGYFSLVPKKAYFTTNSQKVSFTRGFYLHLHGYPTRGICPLNLVFLRNVLRKHSNYLGEIGLTAELANYKNASGIRRPIKIKLPSSRVQRILISYPIACKLKNHF